jgi:hypothetical protein
MAATLAGSGALFKRRNVSARRAGALLSRAGTSDVIDAALALLAEDGDEIITSDPKDLTVLIGHMPVDVELFPV